MGRNLVHALSTRTGSAHKFVTIVRNDIFYFSVFCHFDEERGEILYTRQARGQARRISFLTIVRNDKFYFSVFCHLDEVWGEIFYTRQARGQARRISFLTI